MRNYGYESDSGESESESEYAYEEADEDIKQPKKKVVKKVVKKSKKSKKYSSSSDDSIPNDKYYSLSRKSKDIKRKKPIFKTPLKVPKKPQLAIQYNEVESNTDYKNNYKGINEKDERLYNKAQTNIENTRKIINRLNKEIEGIINEMYSLSTAKKRIAEKKITDIEQDIIQLNKLYRYYIGIIAQLDSKYL